MRVVCGKPGAVRHAAALVRALAATSGAAALRRGLPVYGGLFALVGLLFGGNGLQAATVVGGVGDSPLARALLKKRVDDEVHAQLPGGPARYAIIAVQYPDPPL